MEETGSGNWRRLAARMRRTQACKGSPAWRRCGQVGVGGGSRDWDQSQGGPHQAGMCCLSQAQGLEWALLLDSLGLECLSSNLAFCAFQIYR